MAAFVYMLRRADGSYYVGSTSASLEKRIAEHESGAFPGYTFHRRPVRLIWSESFEQITDAITAERQIKGWSRTKKEALVRGDWEGVRQAARRAARKEGVRCPDEHPSRLATLAPQDDVALPPQDGSTSE
ncbi:GIY-YIG nuclease family protein [Ancylobacter sp. TS-1]|nr:GIY-YIG nuclease family protein [Ancylobacter sp. TS-1]